MTANPLSWIRYRVVAAVLMVVMSLVPTTFGATEIITDVSVGVSSYPNDVNYIFRHWDAHEGYLILESTGSDRILTGNVTLERNGTVQYDGFANYTFLCTDPRTSPMTPSTITLGGFNLLLENSFNLSEGGGATSQANTFLGGLSGAGMITARGNHPEDPERQQTIVHLTGDSLTPTDSITFNIASGGLSIDNPNALPNVATLNSTYSASLILPTTATTLGNGFTYHLQGTSDCTNIGGSILLGTFYNDGRVDRADVNYSGQITYNNTDYFDSLHREWKRASVIVGQGTFNFLDGAFDNTDALAIGGGYDYTTGRTKDSVWATLKVSDQSNLAHLPHNLGFCGGKLDLSSLGSTVDLTGYRLCAIAIAVRDGDPYPGGGSVIVDGTHAVTMKVNAADLMTDNGIVALERNVDSNLPITVEVNCQGGTVDPSKFAGFKLPANATLKFTNFSGTTANTGNIEGAGTVDAGGKNLAVGSGINTSGAFTGTLEDVNTLEKVGSATTNIGNGANVTASSAEIQQGNLAVQGGATFNVENLTVENGGTLSGTGTIQGNVTVKNGGMLAPGNSIYSSTTAGNLTVQSGGNVQIQTLGLAGGQTTGNPGIDNDVERVTQSLTFERNARIVVTEDSTNVRPYKTGDKYYAMVAEQGVTHLSNATMADTISGMAVGSYGVEAATHTMRAVDGTGHTQFVDVTGDWIWFDLVRGFTASTPNGRRVSDNIITVHDAGQLGTLYTTLDGLTSDQQSAALQQLSGESLATSQSLSLDGTMIFTRVLHNRIRPGSLAEGQNGDFAFRSTPNLVFVSREDAMATPWNSWATGYGVGGAIHGNADTTATSVELGGLLVGIDRQLAEDTKLGFFFNYDQNIGRLSSLAASTRVEDHFFGGYLTDRHDGWYWLSTAGAGYDHYQSSRWTSFGQIAELDQAGFHGWQSQVYGEAGLNGQWGKTSLQPYVGLQYIYLRGEGLTENIAMAPNSALVGEGTDYNALQTHLGAHVARTLSIGGRPSSIEFRSAWLHQLLNDTAPVLDAQFAAAPGSTPFSVVGADLARDWCWLGTGLQCQLAQRVSLYADYEMLFNTAQTIHTGSGGLVVMW